MILDHYLQLFHYYRKLIAWTIFGLTGTVVGFSVILLFVFPFYTGTATVQLMPTEAELAYMSGLTTVGLAGNNPAEMLPATQMEYLMSRPVAERVLDKVRNQLDREPPVEGWRLTVKNAVNETVSFLWMVYNTLNSGKFVEPTPYEQALNRLMKGIDLEAVENSYILQIDVTLPQNPKAAALAANALAEAYIERVHEQSAKTADKLIASLGQEVEKRLGELRNLQKQEFELRKNAGIVALEQERDSLLAQRDAEQERLLEIRIQREESTARLKAYEEDRAELQRRGTLAMVDQEIALSDAQMRALDRREAVRKQSIDRINKDLAALNERENPLLDVQREIDRVQGEIDDLRNKQIVQNLVKNGGLSQARIVNPAIVPDYASFPEIVINTAVAIVASIFLVLIGVVAADTLSNSVKTTVDLRRLAGSLGIGGLPKDLFRTLRRNPTAGVKTRLQESLRRAGAELETRMASHGLLESPHVLVTGLGSSEFIGLASLGLAGAIAARGADVRWRPPRDFSIDNPELLAALGIGEPDDTRTESQRTGKESLDRPTISIECMGPIAAGFGWRKITENEAAVVYAFAGGALAEDELLELRETAVRNGVPEMAFLLIPS